MRPKPALSARKLRKRSENPYLWLRLRYFVSAKANDSLLLRSTFHIFVQGNISGPTMLTRKNQTIRSCFIFEDIIGRRPQRPCFC